jgi:hypothetical protein
MKRLAERKGGRFALFTRSNKNCPRFNPPLIAFRTILFGCKIPPARIAPSPVGYILLTTFVFLIVSYCSMGAANQITKQIFVIVCSQTLQLQKEGFHMRRICKGGIPHEENL